MAGVTCIWKGGQASSTTVYGTVGNWDSSVPLDSDTVIIPAFSSYGIAGTDASSVNLAGFVIEDGYSENIGSDSATLHINLTAAAAGDAFLAGDGICHLQIDDYANIFVRKAGAAPSDGECALNLTGALGSAGNLFIDCGPNESVGLNLVASRTRTLEADSIYIGGGEVSIGSGVFDSGGSAAPDVVIKDGDCESRSAILNFTQEGGVHAQQGAAAISFITVRGGSCNYNSNAAFSSAVISGTGKLDFSGDTRPITLGSAATADVHGGGTINDPQGRVTWSTGAGIDLNQCSLKQVSLDIGPNFKILKTTVT